MQNTAKFGRNLVKYMSVQQFWNLSKLLGVFTCCKVANLCQNLVTETCKQRSETTRHRLCCKKLGTSHDVKGFAIASFLEHIVVERAMMTSVKNTLKMLVWLAQKRSISSEICPEQPQNPLFFTDCFPAKFAPKIPVKSADFSAILSLKIPQNLTCFRDLSEALYKDRCSLVVWHNILSCILRQTGTRHFWCRLCWLFTNC